LGIPSGELADELAAEKISGKVEFNSIGKPMVH